MQLYKAEVERKKLLCGMVRKGGREEGKGGYGRE